jgi:hypothetical protein
MNCRRHGSKPTLALWMLVAVADIAIVVATTGLLTMLLVAAGLATVAGIVVGVRLLSRRDAPNPETVLRRRA